MGALMGGLVIAAILTGTDLVMVILLAAGLVIQTSNADAWREKCRRLENEARPLRQPNVIYLRRDDSDPGGDRA